MRETRRHALIYCRVSTRKQQEDGHGLESQELRCREYAKRQGYAVERVFHDSFTGGGDFAERPAMQALLAYLDEHPATDYVVVFDDLKRFARDVRFHWQLRTELQARSASVECPNFRFEETPEGEFIETILAAQGELERKQNKRQTVQKMKARLLAGYWPFHHPPGYRFVKSAERGRVLVPFEPEAALIAEAFEAFGSGRFQEQCEVECFLEERGFKKRVYPSQVRRILSRVLYAGYVEYEPWGISRRKAQHEGLVSLETFERVQERLEARAPVRLRVDYRPDFPLRGFVLCASCGRFLTASFSTGRGGRYPYYRCNNQGCHEYSKGIPSGRMEEQFAELLKDIEPHPYVLDLTEAIACESWQERMAGGGGERERWERERRLCETEIERVATRAARTENERLLTAYEGRVADFEKRIQRLTERLERQETNEPDFGTALKEVLGFVKSPYDIWDSGDLTDRRMVLSLAFEDSISYDREAGFGTPNLSPGLAVLREIEGACFRDVRVTDETRNERHFNRSGHLVRVTADNGNESHSVLDGYSGQPSDNKTPLTIASILAERWNEFRIWVEESRKVLSELP